MGALRSILAEFDIQVKTEQLDVAESKISSFIGQLGAVGAALAATKIVTGMIHFAEGVAAAARQVEFHAGRLDLDTDSYQKLNAISENYGVTVEQLTIGTTLFTRALGNAGGILGVVGHKSGHAAEAFKALGLNAEQFKGKKLEEVLPVIADAMVKIEDPMLRLTTGLNLFGHRGRAMMVLMAKGGDELRHAMGALQPVFEKATIEQAKRADIAGKNLGRTWDNLVSNSLGRAAMAIFEKVADRLSAIVQVIKEVTKYSEIGMGILVVLGGVVAALGGIIIVALAPVLLVIGAVVLAFALLAAIVDSFLVFMEGGDSVISDFFDEILGPGGADKARQFFIDLQADVKSFITTVKEVLGSTLFTELNVAAEMLLTTLKAIRASIEFIEGKWDTVRQALGLPEGIPGASAKSALGVFVPELALGAQITQTVAQTLFSEPSRVAADYGVEQVGYNPNVSSTVNVSINAALPAELGSKMRELNQSSIDQYNRDTVAAIGGAK